MPPRGAAAVVLLDVDSDSQRLLAYFDHLGPEGRSRALRYLATEACAAAHRHGGSANDTAHGREPAGPALAEALLMRCLPVIPCGYHDDFGFEDAYRERAAAILRQKAVRIALGSCDQDERHAAELVGDLRECAAVVGKQYVASDFGEDGFIGPDSVRSFIEDWRDSFEAHLSKLVARAAAARGSS